MKNLCLKCHIPLSKIYYNLKCTICSKDTPVNSDWHGDLLFGKKCNIKSKIHLPCFSAYTLEKKSDWFGNSWQL